MKLWMVPIGVLLAAGTFGQDPAGTGRKDPEGTFGRDPAGEFGRDFAGTEEIARDLLENGQEEEAEELYAMVTGQLDRTIDLNSCSKEELSGTGIFTPFQVFAILDQRNRYGPFLSLYELAAIPGIDREFLEEIRRMIGFTPAPLPEPSRQAEVMILNNISARLPVTAGMLPDDPEPPAYQGDLLKFTQRIRLAYGEQLTLGAAIEKDEGELWINRKRPEHLTGYLAYTPDNCIKKLVIGNFRIHRGMGLVHGLGFSSRGAASPLTGYRRSYVKPFASTLEYDYFRGFYGAAAAGKWEMDLFLSHQPADISFFRIKEKHDLFGMTRKTGLHRTLSERQGVDLARLSAAGASVNRSAQNYYAGCAFTAGQMYLSKTGMDSLRTLDPGKAHRTALSFYGVAFGSTYELYGEIAIDNTFQSAFHIGGRLVINPALSCDASVKRTAPSYRGVMPRTERENEDEYNLHIGCNLTPFRYGRIRLFQALALAAPGSSPVAPPEPERYTIMEYTRHTGNGPELTIKYTGKTSQEIKTLFRPGTRKYETLWQQHFRVHYRWEASEKIRLQGRIELSLLWDGGMTVSSQNAATGSNHGTGSMAYQQVQVVPREGIRITYRFLLFHVPDWENRIYTYEPGVRYSFLFPAWYGKGSRNVLVVSAKISRRITIRGKCGLTSYAYRWNTGSGNDLRNGNRMLDAELQLQANLF